MFQKGDNTDKRTYRRECSRLYSNLIHHYKSKIAIDIACSDDQLESDDVAATPVRVFVRKRPIFEREHKVGEFDAVHCRKNEMVIHECGIHPSMKPSLAFIEPCRFSFPCHRVFDENSSTNELYDKSLGHLVREVVDDGCFGTLFCFGQTGSGKTYTLSGMIECMSKDVFKRLSGKKVQMTCIELIGESVYDLLNDHRDVAVRDGGDGEFVLCDNKWVQINKSQDICDLYHVAGSLRETHATKVNTTSSRSHYICRISFQNNQGIECGRLTLCDLAGSERNIDSNEHDSDRLRETAQINKSLMALKDVIRSIAQKKEGNTVFIPFRASKLTRILKDSFESVNNTKTVVIATVSPKSCDIEHSMGTLKNVCLMGNISSQLDERIFVKDVMGNNPLNDQIKTIMKMSNLELMDWIGNLKGGAFKQTLGKFPKTMDGKTILRQSEKRLQQILDNETKGSELRCEIIKYSEKVNAQKSQNADNQRNGKISVRSADENKRKLQETTSTSKIRK